jgi:hypothetical protein
MPTNGQNTTFVQQPIQRKNNTCCIVAAILIGLPLLCILCFGTLWATSTEFRTEFKEGFENGYNDAKEKREQNKP